MLARIYNFKRGASLFDEVLKLADQEGIKTATLQAVGGVNRLTIAYFNQKKKEYEKHDYREFLEVTGLVGNLTQKEGKPFLHMHGTFGRRDMSVIGGHVMSATVFPILEMVITPTTNRALRHFDDELGLNVIYSVK
jgi:predicted DNA-binding protein with PD1-like motif